jgi:nucleoside-diphosphate-sugar epimerase
MAHRQAVVVGALGVIGRNLVRHLLRSGWEEVVGLSRRSPDFDTGGARYVSVDLLDRADAEAKLSGMSGATHLFYCAFQARPTWAEHNAPNLAMLVNAVEPVEEAAPNLRHVQLIEGTKIYGSHLGPFKTPAKETDPPHMPPNFYADQEDWLRRAQQGKRWTWSALRPQTVCGFALGNPMNLMTLLAVYATVSRELGLPLRFPGKPGAFTSLYQVTDADHLAAAMEWAALSDTAANQVFNLTNGDFFRWQNLWPALARFFGMEAGPVQTIPLAQFMADKGPLWEEIVRRRRLRPIPYADLVSWPFGDYVFGCDWDVMSDTTKIRQAGFLPCIDSETMFLRYLGEFRRDRIIP